MGQHTQNKSMNWLFLITITLFLPSFLYGGDAWSYNNIETFCYRQQYNRTVRRDGCDPESFVVHACLGNCRSYQKPLQDVPYFQSVCLCCKASEKATKEFTLTSCRADVDKRVVIESAVTCNCERTDTCS